MNIEDRAGDLAVLLLDTIKAPMFIVLAAAEQLLGRLGALADGKITEQGKRMARLPVHPRLGRLLSAGQEYRVGDAAAAAAALLSERDIRLAQRSLTGGRAQAEVAAPSDVVHLLELLELAQAGRLSRAALVREGLDPDAVARVERARRQLARLGGGDRGPRLRDGAAREQALQRALLAAYPDRVARRRPRPPGEAPEFILASGGSAVLAASSVAHEVELAVLIDVEDRTAAGGRGGRDSGRVLVRTASAIEADWLIELRIDCDKDSILVFVDQIGPACHTNRPSCFYHAVRQGQVEIISEPKQ